MSAPFPPMGLLGYVVGYPKDILIGMRLVSVLGFRDRGKLSAFTALGKSKVSTIALI